MSLIMHRGSALLAAALAAGVAPAGAFVLPAGARAALPHRALGIPRAVTPCAAARRGVRSLRATAVSGAAAERVLELVLDTDMGANSTALPLERRKALYEDLDALEASAAAAGERDLFGPGGEAVVRTSARVACVCVRADACVSAGGRTGAPEKARVRKRGGGRGQGRRRARKRERTRGQGRWEGQGEERAGGRRAEARVAACRRGSGPWISSGRRQP